MRVFTDQVGRQITLPDAPPRRIVSLVPSQTELLARLGLDEEVVGITKFCIQPHHWFKSKKRIGGTKDVKIEEVMALQPDLIIANKEENEQGVLEILGQFAPVWISDVRSLQQAQDMIAQVGQLVDKQAEAARLLQQIQQGFDTLMPSFSGLRVLYLIWYRPWMAAGSDTFIGSILEQHLGATLCVPAQPGRYPQVEETELQSLGPDVVMLSSEPFPFQSKHVDQIKRLCPEARIMQVAGDMFSWYGSRLVEAAAYLKAL